MKNLQRKLLSVLAFVVLVGCNSSSKNKQNNVENGVKEGVYEAVFIDVNGIVIDSTISPNVKQYPKKLSNINLISKDQFWGEKSNFMLRGLGALKVNESGDYYFKLTSSGKVKLQLNNVDLVKHETWHELESKNGMRKTTCWNFNF